LGILGIQIQALHCRQATIEVGMKTSQRGLTRFSDLVPDDRNANHGSKRGAALIKKSLRDYGARRSILLDKNNRVIAGNKTLEQASERQASTDGTERRRSGPVSR
jgi:hypothetical protein